MRDSTSTCLEQDQQASVPCLRPCILGQGMGLVDREYELHNEIKFDAYHPSCTRSAFADGQAWPSTPVRAPCLPLWAAHRLLWPCGPPVCCAVSELICCSPGWLALFLACTSSVVRLLVGLGRLCSSSSACTQFLACLGSWSLLSIAPAAVLAQLLVQPVDAGLQLLHGCCLVAVGRAAAALLHLLPGLRRLLHRQRWRAVGVLHQDCLLSSNDGVPAAGSSAGAGLSPQGHVPCRPGGDACSSHAPSQCLAMHEQAMRP